MLQVHILASLALLLPPPPPFAPVIEHVGFILAKEGIPKVQPDLTRSVSQLNGLDVWADIPEASYENRAKGTTRVYQSKFKSEEVPARTVLKEELPTTGYKTIAEEIAEDKAKAAANPTTPKKTKNAACFYCLN